MPCALMLNSRSVLLQGHATAKPALERVLTQAREALHPMHAVIVDCLMPLVNCSRATQDHAAAIRYLQQLLADLETIIGCPSVEVVLLLGLPSGFTRPMTQSSATQDNLAS